ncbi:MAG: hypothetical protein WC661_21165 [Opitutaceae bacterium]|jgi:hypothetical protein
MTISRDSDSVWSRVWLFVGLAACAVLCAYVLTRTKPPFFDEVPYLAQAQALTTSDSVRGWLLDNDTGPAGPVHAMMHYALSGGQGVLPVPWFRLPNLVLLGAVLTLTGMHLRSMRVACPWPVALTGMAIPMTWVMAGMALTEMPAMAGIAMATYAAARLGGDDVSEAPVRWGLTCLIALGVALGVCGRQTYLVALPGLLLLAAGGRRNTIHAATGLAAGLLPALWLFSTWGGLIPPKMAFVGAGLKPVHGVVAVCYAGLTAFLLAPGFFMAHWLKALPLGVLLATVNVFSHTVPFTTMTSVQRLLGYPGLARALEAAAGWFFVAIGVAFLTAIGLELWIRRDRRFAGLACSVLALCAVCMAVTHLFSSRYIGMTLPFMVPMLAPWIRFGPWTTVRLLVPMGIGASSLVSYYALA